MDVSRGVNKAAALADTFIIIIIIMIIIIIVI
jgi:hypothetical protein